MTPQQQKTVNAFLKLLKEDKEMMHAYKANIAMSFQDEYHRHRVKHFPKGKRVNSEAVHKIANTAAKNFLNLLMK